jgi:hypothetical protein
MGKKTNYDILDKLLQDSQRDRTGSGKVLVQSDHHPDGGYWCDESEANVSWETQKNLDEVERYFRS